MRIQYMLSEQEIQRAKDRLKQLRHVALLSRDSGHMEDNREYYLRAQGFKEALTILGIMKEEQR